MNIDKIVIEPLKSFNGIEFGTARDDIWKLIGKPIRGSFKKFEDNKVETDDYYYFHIYYDDNYNFEGIEVFNDLDIYYGGEKLSKKYSEVLDFFKNKFDDVEEEEDGFVTIKGSIGTYIENDEDILDSIMFARKDYYNL